MSGPKLVLSIFLVIIFSIGALSGFYFYLNRTTTLKQAPIVPTKPTFSGFDQVALDNMNNNTEKTVDLGSYTGTTTVGTSTATSTATTTPPETDEQLRLISAQPIAGYDFIIRDVDISTSSVSIGTSTKQIKLPQKNKNIVKLELIRYILKATGNILETGTSSTSTVARLTNKTLPKLQEAVFNSKGDGVLIRNIVGDDGVQTRYLSLKPITDTGTTSTSTIQNVTVTDLPINITQLTSSPDRAKIFYTRNSGTRGTISGMDGGGKIGIFESPFREWLPQWMTTNTILMNTKPSGLAPGYLYTLDVKTGLIKKILGNIVGLTSLGSNDGLNILYTETANNRLRMNLYNLKENSNWLLPAETLPEKCVWGNKYTKVIYCAVPKVVSKDHIYPDDWYLGLTHFDDAIWRMNLDTGENKLIVDPIKQIPFSLDIVNMKLSKNDDYLIFEDKNTLSLWGMKLKNNFPVATSSAKTTSKK